jgi:ferric-dicitrate binding protein FerR (iron transport regulator)
VVAVLAAGALVWKAKTAKQETPAFVSVFHNDIPPGRDLALLTLGDGSKVTLNSVDEYVAAQARNGETTTTGKRQLFRTLTTPAAGQFRLTLADGTRVWLNAQSSIRYPTAFGGKTRFVEVTGEAYFDVAKDAKRPFVVKAGNLTVQALGTQFNVHAYPDELSASATLIQGSVRVINRVDSLLLTPGQEGNMPDNERLTLNTAVDTSQVAAWKEGYFDFDNQDLQAIMRQFERWYAIKVVFAGKPGTAPFAGRMQRSLTLSQVMTGLGRTGVRSRLEGRMLTILP